MANRNQFDEGKGREQDKPTACLVCEAMLPDAVDGTLNEAEQRAFDKHVAGCMACADELAEAQRGAAWLTMLKGHTPESRQIQAEQPAQRKPQVRRARRRKLIWRTCVFR